MPLSVRFTLFAAFATIVCVTVPVESRLPVPFCAWKSFTVNVSLPTGALTVPLQTVVQFTTSGVPSLTAIEADCVAGETNAGRFAAAAFAAGIAMLKATPAG